MFTYKVVFPDSSYKIIEAEYFTVTSDGFGANDAYFYVTKTVKERELRSRSADPAVTQKILVGYVHNPQVVQLADNFVYQPPDNNAQTEALDK